MWRWEFSRSDFLRQKCQKSTIRLLNILLVGVVDVTCCNFCPSRLNYEDRSCANLPIFIRIWFNSYYRKNFEPYPSTTKQQNTRKLIHWKLSRLHQYELTLSTETWPQERDAAREEQPIRQQLLHNHPKRGAKRRWRVDGCFPEKCIIFIIE